MIELPTHRLMQRRLIANLLLASAVLLCTMLVVAPPSQFRFYPLCPIHQYLHIDCPGCGATRALAALLHGRFAEALQLNAFFVLLLPFAAVGALECYRRAMRPGEFRWPQLPAQSVYATTAAAAVFMVVRNLSH